MNLRNKLLTLTAVTITIAGIIATFVWDAKYGLASVLLLNLLIVVLVILERRQLGKTQQRLLKVIKSNSLIRKELTNLDVASHVDLKRIAGIVQAQHISLENIASSLLPSLHSDSGSGPSAGK